jgi:hypothetical protein
MPFIPELFSAPALARIEDRRQARMEGVSFFDGLTSGEIDALVGSFAGDPEVHQEHARMTELRIYFSRWPLPRALRHRRRRPLLRAGVQRRCSGPEGVAARSRHRGACPRRQRQAHRRPHLRRRPPVAESAPQATKSN